MKRPNNMFSRVHEYIVQIMPQLKHPAEGLLVHPYLSVSSGQHYASCIYSWDNHHMALRFAAEGQLEQMCFFLENMLRFQSAQGYVPSIVSVANGGLYVPPGFHAQPFLAQNAAIYVRHTRNLDWAGKIYKQLQLYLEYWLTQYSAPFGLYRWRENYMSGIDNEIVGTIFLPDTIISPDLNAWLYLELRSMAYLAESLQDTAAAVNYKTQAEQLKAAINTYLWDEEYGTYAALDLTIGKTRIGWCDGTLSGDVGKFAFLSCPALIPLFARIAEPECARQMITNYVLNPEHFRSPYGIRSLSRSSEYYNNARWGNPPRFGNHHILSNSNWQGPVWIPLNWFVFHALLHYGFSEEAEKLADDTYKVIAMSLDQLGYMRENFHGETGEPLYADYFASWNILADLMPDYLSDGKSRLGLFF